jgi:hypothetical protein
LPCFHKLPYFDHDLPPNRTYVVVFPGSDEADSCKCAVVRYHGPQSRTPWQAMQNGVPVGYPTWCLGACGANCGEGHKYLRADYLHRRVGALAHDVCQAFHNLTDGGVFAFTNRCAVVALHSIAMAAELFLRGQCGDGPPLPDGVQTV